jgi:formate hydrogenlyase subunit 3/multisubunit Na+/H+ antiporter MnhD subunit
MTALDRLLLLSALSAAVLFWVGRRRWAGWLSVGLYGVQLALLAALLPELRAAGGAASSVAFTAFGNGVGWSLSGFGWFFALLTVGTALFCAWFSAGEWGRYQSGSRLFHGSLALNVLAMLVLLSSADLLSLFIGWELVSWASYLIMTQRGGAAERAAFRYLIYAMVGAMAVLGAVVLAYLQVGSLGLAELRAVLPELSDGVLWTLVLLFACGFGIKMALVPFHLWQAEAYAETPGPASAFVSAIAARMGLFALLLVLMQLIGADRLTQLALPFTFWDARELLAWVAAVTMVVPTYIALTQNDARMLLAWHGIGQGGYMLLGALVATPMGVAGGLMHVFNYATYQAPLFLAVTAVAYRTGTTELDRLGGLITRMPLSYVAMLMGIIGLAGLPPMNGFVSKWLIYKALLDARMPLLFVAAVVGTLGTILSVYKLIHNTFLGQLRVEHEQVREVPWSMSLPMLAMAAIAFITGFMPGLALDLVDVAQPVLGVAALPHHLGGVDWATGSLNMLWVVGAMLGSIGFGALVFLLGNRSYRVHQLDNYAGGHFLSAEVRYHYSHDFYAGLLRVIGPWFRGSVLWAEKGLVSLAEFMASAMHGFYRAAYTPLYLLAGAVLALWWMTGG